MTQDAKRLGLVAIGALLLFVILAGLATSGLTQDLDTAGLKLVQGLAAGASPLRAAWLVETARDYTALGSNPVLAVLACSVAVCLALGGRRRDAACLMATFVAILLLVTASKFGFGRARPDLTLQAARVFTMSFPSSHSALSAAIGTALILLQWRERPLGLGGAFAAAVILGLVLLVGFSRVYLGVHWPADVLAGWSLGFGTALLCRALFVAGACRIREAHSPGRAERQP